MSAQSQIEMLHGVMAHQRRLDALRCLEESTTPITVAELAEDVARQQQGSNLSEIPNSIVKQIHLSLYHVDIPKMADAGLIEYESQMKTVRYDGHPEIVEELLNV